MVNVDQEHDLQTRTKNKTGNKSVNVILWHLLNIICVKKQYILHILI